MIKTTFILTNGFVVTLDTGCWGVPRRTYTNLCRESLTNNCIGVPGSLFYLLWTH